MEYSIFDLLKKYHKKDMYEMKIKMNLNRNMYEKDFGVELYNQDGLYILEQEGGDIKEVIIGDKKYQFDLYVKKESDLRRVFIKSFPSGYPWFKSKNPDIESDHCAQLAYLSGSDIIKIESLNGLRGCIKIKSEESGKVEKQGTMLMYAIIEWSKRKGFKKIILEDISKIECINKRMLDRKPKMLESSISYSLYYGYILQSGYPWYWKFGFRYEEEILNTKLEENKRRLDSLRVESLGFEDIINILISKLELERYIDSDMLDNKTLLRKIGKMSEIYKKHIGDDTVYEYFREMYMECCEIMGLITGNISKSLGIEDVRGSLIDEVKRMVLLL